MTPDYYNEIDEYAAQWLRNLIAAGHLPPGDVDTRSIEDVRPDDLSGYRQCHFFAGIGVWPLALRLAGWPGDKRVWTGSCPCQPFSAAGKGAGFADERHLWPAFHHLIAECRPAVVLGEQVASAAVDAWIDLVHADLEALDYAFGSVPFPSAGVGAPHIRDRNYWVAYAYSSTRGQRSADVRGRATGGDAQPRSGLGRSGMPHRLDDAHHSGLEGQRGGYKAEGGRIAAVGSTTATGEFGGLADADGSGRQQLARVGRSASLLASPDGEGKRIRESCDHGASAVAGPGPTNGYWRDADWLGCRDGKWRPVEPGTFPLAHGSAGRVGRVRADQERLAANVPRKDQGSRVGRLRAYGNAINAEAARVFIEAVMECMP